PRQTPYDSRRASGHSPSANTPRRRICGPAVPGRLPLEARPIRPNDIRALLPSHPPMGRFGEPGVLPPRSALRPAAPVEPRQEPALVSKREFRAKPEQIYSTVGLLDQIMRSHVDRYGVVGENNPVSPAQEAHVWIGFHPFGPGGAAGGALPGAS